MSKNRELLRAYVRGLSPHESVRKDIDQYVDAVLRDAASSHRFVNDMGGTMVCTDCWRDLDDNIHKVRHG